MLLFASDVGGTFTDCVAFDEETGNMVVSKVPSTPSNQERGVMQGIEALNVDLANVRRVVHGTTVGANAIMERRGARVAIVTTEGFKDVIEIGRTLRYTGGLFDPKWVCRPALVPGHLRFVVQERINYKGEVLRELRDEDVQAISLELKRLQVEAVAVCFLHSYINPDHEARASKVLEEYLPGVPIVPSVDIVPEYREYERFSTTVMSAYITPLIIRYLRKLNDELRSKGYKEALFVVSSNGGQMAAETACRYAIRTIQSGPVGGVAGGTFVARATDHRNVITLDMGGTSTDVCLVKDLQPTISSEQVLDGLPIKTPLVDIKAVGAGGGSIAWVDIDGSLMVGPQSAAAVPGPASYARGGTEATITDANLFLNRIGPSSLLRGTMTLSRELSERAIANLAGKCSIPDLYRVAEGVIKIAVTNVCGAIREVSTERGYDPRDFVLLAFGGAGPMHGIPVAMELGCSKVLVPRNPGGLAAMGFLTLDQRYDFVRTYLAPLKQADVSKVAALLREMTQEGQELLLQDGVARDRINMSYSADMRYIGEGWELNVSLPGDGFNVAEVEQFFHREHRRTYGHSREGKEAELVNLRVVSVGGVDKPAVSRFSVSGRALSEAIIERRTVYFEGEFVDCPIYDRDLLPPQVSLKGPAIVEELTATTVVFPGWRAAMDQLGNLMLEPRR